MNDVGVLYVATKKEYLEEAKISAKSIKKNTNLEVTVATDKKIDEVVFDKNILIEKASNGFEDKIKAVKKVPYERTLFLDTDTYISSDIEHIFESLDTFDLAVCLNVTRYTHELSEVPNSIPEYNTGVIAYKENTNIKQFLKKWHNYYNELGINNDQPSFRKAVYSNSISLLTLRREYNCIFRREGQVDGKVKIFHGRLTKVDGPGATYNESIEDIKDVERIINESNTSRCYARNGLLRLYYNNSQNILEKVIGLFVEKGLIDAVKEITNKIIAK